MKLGRLFTIAGPMLLGLTLVPAAWGQKLASARKNTLTERKKTKDKKVWYNEDVAMLRVPDDMFAEPKRNPEEAANTPEKAGKKPQAATKIVPAQTPAPAFVPPSTLEEAEKRLAAKQDEVRQKVELIENRRKEFLGAQDQEVVQTLTKEMEPALRDLNNAEAQMKLLETSIEQLKSSSTTAGRL